MENEEPDLEEKRSGEILPKQETPNGLPLLVIVGIDPAIHEIPPMLAHHVGKLKRDFVLGFLARTDITEKTGEALLTMLDRSKFVPAPKKQQSLIIKPGDVDA